MILDFKKGDSRDNVSCTLSGMLLTQIQTDSPHILLLRYSCRRKGSFRSSQKAREDFCNRIGCSRNLGARFLPRALRLPTRPSLSTVLFTPITTWKNARAVIGVVLKALSHTGSPSQPRLVLLLFLNLGYDCMISKLLVVSIWNISCDHKHLVTLGMASSRYFEADLANCTSITVLSGR